MAIAEIALFPLLRTAQELLEGEYLDFINRNRAEANGVPALKLGSPETLAVLLSLIHSDSLAASPATLELVLGTAILTVEADLMSSPLGERCLDYVFKALKMSQKDRGESDTWSPSITPVPTEKVVLCYLLEYLIVQNLERAAAPAVHLS